MAMKTATGPVTGLYIDRSGCYIEVGGEWFLSLSGAAGPVFSLAADARRAGTGVWLAYDGANPAREILEIQSL